MNTPPYERLPGRARRRMGLLDGTRGELHLAPDHLLCIEIAAYSERPHIVYLKDIRAISIRPTREHLVATLGFAALAALFWIPYLGLSFFVQSVDPAADAEFIPYFAWGAALLSAVVALIIAANLALGPRCLCRIHTAASAIDLVGQSRLRTARRVRDLLAPRIRAAQQDAAE